MKKRLGWLLILTLIPAIFINARVQLIKSRRALDRVTGKAPFSAVLFYKLGKENRKNKELKEEISELKEAVRAASDRSVYKHADMKFLMVDTADKQFADVSKEYNIGVVPALVLFNNGLLVKGGEKTASLLQNNMNRESILSFIDDHLQKDINTYRKEKEKEARRRAQEQAMWAPYFYYGWGGSPWGYPYWGGGGRWRYWW